MKNNNNSNKSRKISPRNTDALVTAMSAMDHELVLIKMTQIHDPERIKLVHTAKDALEKALVGIKGRSAVEAKTNAETALDAIGTIPPANFHLQGVLKSLAEFIRVQDWAIRNPLPTGPKVEYQKPLRSIAEQLNSEGHHGLAANVTKAAECADSELHFDAAGWAAVVSLDISKTAPSQESDEKQAVMSKRAGVLAKYSAMQRAACTQEQQKLLKDSARALNKGPRRTGPPRGPAALVVAYAKMEREQANG